jgi:hypothetical protein
MAGGGTALDGPIAELNALVGLEGVKRQVTTLVNLNRMARKRQEAGLPALPMSQQVA